MLKFKRKFRRQRVKLFRRHVWPLWRANCAVIIATIWSGYGFQISAAARVCLFTKTSRLTLEATQPPIEWVPGLFPWGVKRSKREADNSLTYNAKVNIFLHDLCHAVQWPLLPHSRHSTVGPYTVISTAADILLATSRPTQGLPLTLSNKSPNKNFLCVDPVPLYIFCHVVSVFYTDIYIWKAYN